MRVYNTLKSKVEDFVPNNPNEVTMYTCGPTVYHYAHIGNLRTYIFEDVFEKSLKYLGYNVKRVMNITDVGHLVSDSDSGADKMVEGAKREKKSVLEIAAYYTEEFKKDCEKLNIRWPDIVSPATDNISEYIKIIEKLLADDYAYLSGGNVYFDTSKLQDYYVLTNHKEDDMVVGARLGVEEDTSKRNQADFVLWFTKSKFDDQELKWDSPWGSGYPGWHIECSGIALKYFGEYLDIHCGGVDNVFPHHTNEIAQSEGYLGHKWCNYWVHGEHLNDQTGKMSKSKGEFLTASLLEGKGYNLLTYRFMCLNSHYRKQLVFSYEGLDNAVSAYDKLKSKVAELGEEENRAGTEEFDGKFQEALANDLNTAAAVTVLYDVLKSNLSNSQKRFLVSSFDKVLSLDLFKKEEKEIDAELDIYIKEKIAERDQAKKDKNYKRADEIRDELFAKGVTIKDTREGTTYEVK